MNVQDPATWPKRPDLFYRRISHAHPIAHAFYGNRSKSICNGISLDDRSRNVYPTESYSRLCSNCIGALKTLGWMPRAEVVEETESR